LENPIQTHVVIRKLLAEIVDSVLCHAVEL
jgi:hypothetical protein